MSTTGFAAQALGANRDKELTMSLWRPAAMAVLLGLIFIALQYPIMQAAARLIGASEAVTGHAETYFYIRIWGAPFALPGYVIIGWLMGISRVKLSLMIQMLMNALNMLLSIEDTLAANAILWQIQYVMAYLFDGFANASSIIVGRVVGGQNVILCKRAFSLSAQWGCITAIALALGLCQFGRPVLSVFTTIEEAKDIASAYIVWMAAFPFVGYWGLQLEGIFSGATKAYLTEIVR
ncbi:MATE family efflux transporter [Cohnella laeviribosi]|uniref:MATE family efflux transporter n=1 Tax=Cohnella laeviribosi TaxID=380174 RepID=UPI0003A081E6|nr:MATE family efflux transporter [Cohnella laeviribosi]